MIQTDPNIFLKVLCLGSEALTRSAAMILTPGLVSRAVSLPSAHTTGTQTHTGSPPASAHTLTMPAPEQARTARSGNGKALMATPFLSDDPYIPQENRSNPISLRRFYTACCVVVPLRVQS
ncbi:hypothetical protein NDU88_002071 [Pleurodeles waltl]|uniref:Uncharacterized protein n=1 Tax=Pleurodeles waltl TaxID=8319 RepID=A0AAV7M0G3_PLEWA|nr:hypothetical protein NDU88_002071 [Pleurodeles waltl]